jgi:hypothetical protein
MAEEHDSLVDHCRHRFMRDGYRDVKCPIKTMRPDLFMRKNTRSGKVIKEIIVEVEIESTLFKNQTSDQLLDMADYIRQQKRKKVGVCGYLIVPKGKSVLVQAQMLIKTLFLDDRPIIILQH